MQDGLLREFAGMLLATQKRSCGTLGFTLCDDIYGPGPAFVGVSLGLALCGFAGHLWFVAFSLCLKTSFT